MFIEYATHQITKAPEGRHVNSRPRIDIMADTYTPTLYTYCFRCQRQTIPHPQTNTKPSSINTVTGVITGVITRQKPKSHSNQFYAGRIFTF